MKNSDITIDCSVVIVRNFIVQTFAFC